MKGIWTIWLAMLLGSAHAAIGQPDYRLAGIVGNGEFRAALFEIEDGEQKVVRVGDTLGKERLQEVDKDWVLLTGPHGERRLYLEGVLSDPVSRPVRTEGSELLPETFQKLRRLEREIDDIEPEIGRKRFNTAVGLTESARIIKVDHRSFESIPAMLRYVNGVLREDGGVIRLDVEGDRVTEMYLKIDWED